MNLSCVKCTLCSACQAEGVQELNDEQLRNGASGGPKHGQRSAAIDSIALYLYTATRC